MEQRELLDLALKAVDGNQAELARRLGRSETTVSRWVTGRNGIDFESGLRLARLTGLPQHQVIEACGLDPTLVPALASDSSTDPDIAAITAVWPSLDEGIQRAMRILAGVHPVNASHKGGVSASGLRQTRRKRGPNGGFTAAFPTLRFAGAAY